MYFFHPPEHILRDGPIRGSSRIVLLVWNSRQRRVPIRYRNVLGGIIRDYYREAASLLLTQRLVFEPYGAFAAVDPYRAATHNKAIMNGVDAVVMATANDWRAIEAGAHAYAARSGHYTSLSTWGEDDEGNLVGSLEMPMAVGIVGGSTKTHPGARACIKLMGVRTAGELAEIIVSVGLAQNLAALRALATEGIQKGHMALHARKAEITMSIGSVSKTVGDIKVVN
jgi:hydroxymethylglutaryl-CoA reductase